MNAILIVSPTNVVEIQIARFPDGFAAFPNHYGDTKSRIANRVFRNLFELSDNGIETNRLWDNPDQAFHFAYALAKTIARDFGARIITGEKVHIRQELMQVLANRHQTRKL